MRNFLSEMIKTKEYIYNKRCRASADAFIKLKDFVISCEYTSCKRARELIELTFKGYKCQEISQMWGISFETVRCIKRNISNSLWEVFPKDLFEKLRDYPNNKVYVDKCLLAKNYWGLTSRDLIIPSVVNDISHIDENADEEYSSEDLQDELDFLSRYSKVFFKNDLLYVDVSKVKYILDVLDGSKGSVDIKMDFILKLKGEIKDEM